MDIGYLRITDGLKFEDLKAQSAQFVCLFVLEIFLQAHVNRQIFMSSEFRSGPTLGAKIHSSFFDFHDLIVGFFFFWSSWNTLGV